MKKIIASLLAGAVLLTLLNIVQISPARLQGDGLFVDDGENAGAVDEEALYRELFDPNSEVDIAIDISKEQIANIQKDYEYYSQMGAKSTTYRMADSVTFTVNGKKYVIEEVGIRMKGSTSRCNFFNDFFGIYNLINFRISFNRTFDDVSEYEMDAKVWDSEEEREQRRKRTFATLKTMELKWNINADNTYVRNGYVNEVFRDYGIPVQKSHLSTLALGGSRLGIYRFFEPIDENFIHRYFPQEDWGGDLYKVRGIDATPATFLPITTYGVNHKNKAEYYNYDLKTNKTTSQHESMRRLLEVINRPHVTREELDSVADTDELALFSAINVAMGNQDDMRCNYNNLYVYFRQSDGKAVFLPYDCEVVMGATYVWNPPGNGLTEVSPYYDYNYRYDNNQENPLMRQVVIEGGYYTDQYTAYLRDVAGSKWMNMQTFEAYYEPIAAHYSDKLISKYNFMSTIHKNIEFSLEGGEDYNGNMSVAEFMEKMKENIAKNTQNTEDTAERTD